MNTIFRTSLALFLAIFLVSTPNIARAQEPTPATSAQVDALQQTLITLLTQLIAQLQAQITELIAQQALQSTQLGVVQTQVNTVVSQTQPVVVAPTPISVSFGELACDYKMSNGYSVLKIPFSVTGNWSNGSYTLTPEVVVPNKTFGNHTFQSNSTMRKISFDTGDIIGTSTASITIDGQTFSKQIVITDICQ